MKPIDVEIGADQFAKFSKATPLEAVEELVANAYDADADNIVITVERDDIGGVREVRVADDGMGVAYADHERAFGRIGDSLKANQRTSDKGRVYRGRHGRGRYRAFAIGDTVQWTVRHRHSGIVEEYVVDGSRSRTRPFAIAKEPELAVDSKSGVTVVVRHIHKAMPSLLCAEQMAADLSKRLALSLVQHEVNIKYDGVSINPSQHIKKKTKLTFQVDDAGGEKQTVDMTILEWDGIQARCVYLCDFDGMAQQEWDKYDVPSGKTFSFTAYVGSAWVDRLLASNLIAAGGMSGDVANLKAAVREQLNDHFRARLAEQANGLVVEWQTQGVYPYDRSPVGVFQDVSRQVFDVCATTIYDLLPRFQDSPKANRKMMFLLLKQTIEQKPNDVMTILEQVLSLTAEQQKDLSNILKSATLGAVISASKVILDRLKFIAATEHLFFGNHAGEINEPHQLQEILFREHWIFGETYTYPRKEVYLREVLRDHCKEIGREYDINTGAIYDTVEGKKRRVDIMMSSAYTGAGEKDVKHFVVELKRASVEITAKQYQQILTYADTVCADTRFDKSRTKWEWLLVSESVDGFVERQRSQTGRPKGVVHQNESCEVWVKTWGEVVAEVRRRYEFFLESLEAEITANDGLEYLRFRHSEYLPPSLSGQTPILPRNDGKKGAR